MRTGLAAPDRAPPVPATAGTPPWRKVLLPVACSGLPLSGLLFVASYTAATPHVHGLFWAGVGTALATTAAVVALAEDRRRAAVLLTVALAVLLSLPKFLRAPQYFNYYDELAHWRAARALLDGARLPVPNALNKIVTDYPAMHLLTAAVAAVTGGSVFAAGNLVVLAARVCGCLAVFGLAERVAGPQPGLGLAERFAGPPAALLAVLVFAANPAFMYFDAQYAYESLALPLVAVVVLLALRLGRPVPAGPGAVPAAPPGRTALLVTALFLAGLVVVTHHGSSYLLTGVLLLACALAYLLRRPPSGHLLALTGATLAATVGWLFGAAGYTLTYVGPYVRSNLTSIPAFLGGSNAPRRLFSGFPAVPRYEQAASYAAVIVLFGLFGWGAWLLVGRRRDASGWPLFRRRRDANGRLPYRLGRDVHAWLLVLLGSAYFVSLPLVALRGDQVAKRVWEFAFIGLAPVCAVALFAALKNGRIAGRAFVAVLLPVVFVGAGVARSGEHIRFPGPYRPSADPRSMTPDVVAAARWLRTDRGPGHRVVGDRTLAATMGSYGEQTPVTYQESGRPVWKIFVPDTLTPEVRAEIDGSGTEWIAVDRRSADVFPLTGFYFDESEPGAYVDTRLTAQGLAKFDQGPFVRAYDNGHVVLYQVVPR